MARKRELTVEKWLRFVEQMGEYTEMDLFAEVFGMDGNADRKEVVYGAARRLYEHQIADAWKKYGMQVYEFDPDFADSILGEEWMGLLPEVIEYAPHECFYMKLPFNGLSEGTLVNVMPCDRILGFNPAFFPGCEDAKGVYIGGDPDSPDGERGRAVVNTGERLFALCSFAIPKEFAHMTDDTPLGLYPPELVANGVAYLCSANADIYKAYEPQPRLKRNNAKRRSAATWHEVGYRIGSELRAYEKAGWGRAPHQGGTVRPHMRRAHWHHYWIGPRDGERRIVLKWLAPTMVGAGIDAATVHKVS